MADDKYVCILYIKRNEITFVCLRTRQGEQYVQYLTVYTVVAESGRLSKTKTNIADSFSIILTTKLIFGKLFKVVNINKKKLIFLFSCE